MRLSGSAVRHTAGSAVPPHSVHPPAIERQTHPAVKCAALSGQYGCPRIGVSRVIRYAKRKWKVACMAEEERKTRAKAASGWRKDTLVTHAGLSPKDFHGFVNPPVVRASTVLFDERRDHVVAPRSALFLRAHQHSDHRGPDQRADGAGGQAGRRNGPGTIRTCGGNAGPVGRCAPRPKTPDPRQRLRAHAALLRRDAPHLWGGDHLLRSADRRRRSPPFSMPPPDCSSRRRARILSRCRTCRR